MNVRIKSLDWLRGLMAISIMAYHLTGWSFFELDSSGLLGRLGIYGVSIFFILSGLSMAIVYSKYITDSKSSVFFFVRRIFRIWPLLWVCIALAVLPAIVKGAQIDIWLIITNMTTIFGFIKPEAYINTGAWSLGNEMVYYSLTPLFILLYNRKKLWGNMLTMATLLVAIVFSFILLKSTDTLANQWKLYVNPFNNMFLYASGVAIYYNLNDVEVKPSVNALLFILSCVFFVFYPVAGDQIHITTGINRMIFMSISILLVVSFYKFDLYNYVPRCFVASFEQLGIATYGVYLLHPLVSMYMYSLMSKLGMSNNYMHFFSVFVLTVLLSILTFNLFENRMIKIGKALTQNNSLVCNK